MSPEPTIQIGGSGPDSVTIYRSGRAGEHGWSITAYGVDADHAIIKAQRMVAATTNLVRQARAEEAGGSVGTFRPDKRSIDADGQQRPDHTGS
jgi:hypothetical protein